MKYSVINYSTILKDEIKRLEAEFYNSTSSLTSKYYTGAEIVDFVQYGTSKELNEEKRGYPTLRLSEFESLFIKSPEKYCDKIDNTTYQSLSLRKGDVLICRTNGNPKLVGKSAIVLENYDYAFASYLFRIRPDRKKISPATLAVYLNSSVGRNEIEKHLMVSNQANFSPAKFREILIPKLGETIQSLIDEIVLFSFDKHKESNTLYSQAEQMLLSELNLLNWKPKHQLSFVKNHSDTESAGRYDAEYFQPMYEEIEKAIKNYSGGYSLIQDEFKQNTSTFKIDNTKEYNYVEIGSVNVSNGEIIPNKIIGSELPANAKRVLKKGDVIISKVRTYRGAITIVEKDGYVGSGAFTVLREKGQVNKETLFAFLHSKPLLAWSLKPNTGTSYPVIIDEDILNLPIPILAENKQKKIAETVNESFCNRELSNKLLGIAKYGVELAIEKNETSASNYIKLETNKLNLTL